MANSTFFLFYFFPCFSEFSIWLLGYQCVLSESTAFCIFILGCWNFGIFKIRLLDSFCWKNILSEKLPDVTKWWGREKQKCVCVFPSEGSLKINNYSIISDTIVRNSPKLWSFYQICVVKVRNIQKSVFFFAAFGFTVDVKVLKKMIHPSIWWYGGFFPSKSRIFGPLSHEISFQVCIGLKSHFSGWNFVKKTPQKEDDEFEM